MAATLGHMISHDHANPNGVVSDPHDLRHDATPLGLAFMPPATQGSGVAATLGYGTESRWDSRQHIAACRPLADR